MYVKQNTAHTEYTKRITTETKCARKEIMRRGSVITVWCWLAT